MAYNVLVVDDDAVLRKLATRFLESYAARNKLELTVKTADDGAQGLEILMQMPKTGTANGAGIDLVITDGSMPKISGVDLIETGQLTSPKTKYVLMTGEAFKYGRKAAELGVTLLPKPFGVSGFLAAVAPYLKQA